VGAREQAQVRAAQWAQRLVDRVGPAEFLRLADGMLATIDEVSHHRWEAAKERAAALPGDIRPEKLAALTLGFALQLGATGAAAGAAAGSLGAVSRDTWYEVDVTSLVAGDGPVSIRMSSQHRNGADYASSEASTGRPQLVVETGAPPTPDEEAPTTPSNLVATEVLASQVALSWDASTDDTGVTGYEVRRDGAVVGAVAGDQTTFVDGTVTADSSYRYVVRALDAAGNESADSDPLDVTTPGGQAGAFDITRDGTTSTYHATSQTTSTAYSGSLKSVVERALDDLRTRGGGKILFGPGDYDLGSEHFEIDGIVDVEFAGAGMGVTTIRNATDEAADTEPFDAVRSDRLVVRDMTVSAGGSDRTTSDALDFDGGDNILVERVEITDSRGRGIVFDGKDAPSSTGGTATYNVIRDCVVTNTPRDGIQLLAAEHNRIENCHISGAGAEGIRVHLASSNAAQPNKTSDDNVIIGNVIEGSAGNGIAVTAGERNLIQDNTITDSGANGIRIFTSVSSLTCDDNSVVGNTAHGNDWGLTIESSQCHRTVVGENDFSGNRLGAVLDNGTGTTGGGADTTAPTAPAGLTDTAATATSISLAWNASDDDTGVTAYLVYRDGAQVATVPGGTLQYTDTDLAASTAYDYAVRARDAAGNTSGPSGTLTASTTAAPPAGSTIVVPVAADATIRQSSPTSNFGSAATLEVDADSPKSALLKFDVPDLGGGTVTRWSSACTARTVHRSVGRSGGSATCRGARARSRGTPHRPAVTSWARSVR